MYVKGVGMTRFDASDKPSIQLAYEAVFEALQDAKLTIKDMDAVVVSNMDLPTNGERQRHMASILSSLFKTNIPIIRVPAACAGGGAAFWFANKLEEFDNLIVLGSEKLTSMNSQRITEEFMEGAENRWEQPEGLNFPTQNALVAQEYLKRYDATTDDLALIAFKNHTNAYYNPKAKFYGKKVTLENIKNSPVVASPFRLMDCSISVDGAAAVVLSKDKTDIKVVGSGLYVDYLPTFERKDLCTWDGTLLSSKEAYMQAGLQPSDIDIVEVHDAFTIVELLAYEDLGFAKKGEGAKLIRDGTVNADGKLPVNVSGGLKAKGHPVSATGLAQIYELVKQLRRECGERQVKNYLKFGLAQNIGGAGSTITTSILKKISG
ncbi:thiolase family protein [Candidatus Woesearchaeota archaeon]|nr:thiolase family protein [Candidatus Woesearchaeota archaeon]